MRELELLTVKAPTNSTAAGITGAYVDTQGYVGHGHREVKFILFASKGTTAGTCGGSIQTAQDTAGTGVATLVTFSTLTSAGGANVQHGVIPAGHRYVRFLGTVQATKDMYLAGYMLAPNRYSP